MRSKFRIVQAAALALSVLGSAGTAGADVTDQGCLAYAAPVASVPESSRCSFTVTEDTTVTVGGTGKWKIYVALPSLISLSRSDGTLAGGKLGGAISQTDIDGMPFLVVGEPGAPGDSTGGSGRVLLLGGEDLTPRMSIPAPPRATEFGASVATGDVDGDGSPDVVVGAPGSSSVYAFDGRTGHLLTTLASVEPDDDLGAAVAVGDVDGDGLADIVASSPNAHGGAGRITVRGNLSVGAGTFGVEGEPGEGLGRSLALADFDRDGALDIVAGSRGFLDAGGIVIVLDGRIAVRDSGNNQNWLFGESLAVGDLDRDGYPDVVVGAPGASSGDGQVSALDGQSLVSSPSGTPHRVLWDSRADLGSSGGFGSTLAIGDFNGDGIPDVAVGAPGNDRVAVLNNLGRNVNWDFGGTSLSGYGTALAVGDLNRDGIEDLAVGAPLTQVEDPAGGPPITEAGAVVTRETLKTFFQSGDKPTASQFSALIDSFVALTAEPDSSAGVPPGPSYVFAVWPHMHR